MTGPAADEAGERAYFEAIEETFIRLRGAPLLLSPADWQVAARWHREGVPLDLVRRTLEEVFARRRERGARGRIQSLRYCAPAVEAVWQEVREMQAPGARTAVPPLDVAGRLAALAAALPEPLADRERWSGALAGLATPGADPEAVEAKLAELDRALLEAVEESVGKGVRRRLSERAEATLATLAGRLPDDEIEGARKRLERRLLRRELGLPVLSLFSPEAEVGDSGEESE